MIATKRIGFFKGGHRDFESRVAEAMADLLKTKQVAEVGVINLSHITDYEDQSFVVAQVAFAINIFEVH